MAEAKKPRPKCSFCGKSQEDANKLIAAPGVYICDACVDLCCEILTEEGGGAFGWMPKPEPPAKAWPAPRPAEKMEPWKFSTAGWLAIWRSSAAE